MLALGRARIGRWAGLILAAGLLAACQEDKVDPVAVAEAELHAAPRPAKIFTVTENVGLIERRFAGRVESVQTVDLSFQVPGKLVELPVRESQQVQEGDLIAKLDPTDYERDLREARINEEQAKRELARLETLVQRNVISQASYDEQKDTYDLAQEALAEAERNLEYTTLRAPFEGLVSVRLAENFTTVSVGTPVVKIQDISEVQVDINVAEALFGRVREAQVVSIEAKFPAYGDQVFPLEYREHSSQVDEVTQTYRITLGMSRSGLDQLFPGMTASVRAKFLPEGFALGEQFLVPTSAIAIDGEGNAFVWKYDETDSQVSKTPVEIGTVLGDYMPIVSGVDAGDEIVSAGVAYLSDGQTIRRLN